MKKLFFTNRNKWRSWLEKNSGKEKEAWLVYYKKHTGKPSIEYNGAVEEAICFGWIDGKVRRIDEEKFMQRYTPRKANSIWALSNKKRAERMMEAGRMTERGLAKIREAKKSGKWKEAYSSRKKLPLPSYLKQALMKNRKAWKNFQNFANSYQNMYVGWVVNAKRKETRERRIKKVVELSFENKKMIM